MAGEEGEERDREESQSEQTLPARRSENRLREHQQDHYGQKNRTVVGERELLRDVELSGAEERDFAVCAFNGERARAQQRQTHQRSDMAAGADGVRGKKEADHGVEQRARLPEGHICVATGCGAPGQANYQHQGK